MENTSIIINLQLEGFHFWEQAKDILPAVAFLSSPHRHIFHICCKKSVTDDDRQIEIIMFKREITKHLIDMYGVGEMGAEFCNFGGMSCEMIAKELMHTFELNYCSVLEDGENGAEITKN